MNAPFSQRGPLARLIILFSLLFVAAVVVSQVLVNKPAHQRENSFSNEIRIPILASSALQTLDPNKSVELVQYNLDLQIFECLVGIGPEGQIVPALAERWESSSDFKVWTFHLREASFSEDECFAGQKTRQVTADDVIYSWKRGLSPKLGSLNSWALSTCVVGADAFAKGETEDVTGLKKINDTTVQVELIEPDRDFLTRLSVLSTAIVAPEAVKYYGEQFGAHPVGTGPFKLKEWAAGEYVQLERNLTYGKGAGWQPKAPAIEQVRFTFFRSESQISKAFDDGLLDVRDINGADLAQLPDITSLDPLAKLHPEAILVHPGTICRLHLLAPLIGDDYAFGSSSALRRSLAASFDHEQLMASAVGLSGVMTKTLMLPSPVLVDAPSSNNQPLPATAPDASSEALLKGKNVKIAYVSSRIDDVTVALLQKWIEKREGTVRLYPSASINALFASVGAIKPDLTLIYWSPYYPNVENFLTALLSTSRPVPNFTGFSNAELDKSAEHLKIATDNEHPQVCLTIKGILDQEMPWIPLYYETPLILVKSHVRNFKINPVSVMLLSGVEIDHVAGIEERNQ